MSQITSTDIKKILETERDMTVVMDVSNRYAKKTCETLEKQMQVMEKHIEAMERTVKATEKNVEVMEKTMETTAEVMQQQIKAMERNTTAMQSHIQVLESQLNRERKRNERMRFPSDSSDVVVMSPPPPAPETEPINKRLKCDTPAYNGGWASPSTIPLPSYPVPPFLNQQMHMAPSLFQHNPQGQRPPISLQVRRPSRFDRENPLEIRARCFFCSDINNTHDSERCHVLQDHASRARFMNLNFKCLTCAEPRYRCHDASTCRFASRKCQYCSMNHLNALCPSKYPSVNHFNF